MLYLKVMRPSMGAVLLGMQIYDGKLKIKGIFVKGYGTISEVCLPSTCRQVKFRQHGFLEIH